MANGNSKILTEEQELKLRKPIEDHVGKIQEKIDSLRVDGTEKVVHLQGIIDRMKKGSVTDYIRFPEFPVKKISNLVFNMSDFAIFAGIFCLLFRKK